MTSDEETRRRIKILFVSATVPYPTIDGGRIRVLNLVSRLCKIHEVTFLTFFTSPADERGVEYLREMGLEVIGVRARYRDGIWGSIYSLLQSIISRKPLTVAKYYSADMAKTLKDLLGSRSFDVVHFEMLHTGQFLPDRKGEGNYLIILGEQNIDSNVWHRLSQAEASTLSPTTKPNSR